MRYKVSRFLLAFAISSACAGWAGEYRTTRYEDKLIHLYRADPAELSLHWKGDDEKPVRTFKALRGHLETDGSRVTFLMNAGIFEPGHVPSGLHIQDGKELLPLNLEPGEGNFFLKPNGVFLVGKEGAEILASEDYENRKGAPPRFALQSGPLLLRAGGVHPKFRPMSDSLLHRNGVGVLPNGSVLFAMTDLAPEHWINLYSFAMLFKALRCENALFLDGDLSTMWVLQADGTIQPPDMRPGVQREIAPGMAADDEFAAMFAIRIPPLGKADPE